MNIIPPVAETTIMCRRLDGLGDNPNSVTNLKNPITVRRRIIASTFSGPPWTCPDRARTARGSRRLLRHLSLEDR